MKVFGCFSDHMVIQRGEPIRVSGESEPGDAVVVRFCGQEREVCADELGKWFAELAPEGWRADPVELTVTSLSGQGALTFRDILVGDVWLASGQSNMEWVVRESQGAEEELANVDYPNLRLLRIPRRAKMVPGCGVGSSWERCTPSGVAAFSAVAYFFGKQISSEAGVPVGLIDASWGGTRIEAWISREGLEQDPAGRAAIREAEEVPDDPGERASREEYARDPVAWLRRRVPADPGITGDALEWAGNDCDDSGWQAMSVPGKWQSDGHPYSGVFWFRREIFLPPEWEGEDLELRLGACDKQDVTFFNGTRVGGMGWESSDAWRVERAYRIPGALARAGRNVIATRVYSYMTDGGITGPVESMGIARVCRPDEPILIHGLWKYRVEHNFGPVAVPALPYGEDNPNTPAILHENMIRPLLATAVRGILWYQGESNVANARAYRSLFPLLIGDWRRGFGRPGLPFLYVQLANHLAPQTAPVEDSPWAELREAQLLALRIPATAMAVAIDIGDAADIHPRNKAEVGRRLALAALSSVYRQDVCGSGPLPDGFRVVGDSVRVFFRHATCGLTGRDGAPLRGFAIAGADGVFFTADARSDGNSVVLRSPNVSHPSHARYGWANNPDANMVNGAGLPASPFRTDLS